MYIPGKERFTEMTPQEFEEYSVNFLKGQATSLDNGVFEHDVIFKAHDGNYQIDGKIEFEYMGVSFLCLVECKRYKGPVKREHVVLLYEKMLSIGAQKGIFITTSYYQAGALKFAEQHGVALITITDEGVTYCRRGDGLPDVHIPVNGSMFVPVMTRAKTDSSYYDYYLYDKTNGTLRDFLIENLE